MTNLRGRPTTFVGAALAALILGHFAVLLAAHGPTVATAAAPDGHEASWPLVSLIAVMAAVALAWIAIRHLRAIARLGAAAGPRQRYLLSAHVAPYLSRVGRWWVWLLLGVTLLYLALENAEYLWVGAPLPGLDVLHLGEHGAALPLIALVTLTVGAIVALANWCCCALARRLAGQLARTHGRRPPATRSYRPSDVILASTILAGRSAGRSPPAGLASPG